MGIALGLMGGGRVKVSCQDEKERMCRIPGKIRRRIWVREGDYVIIQPWEVQGDSKGDIVWRYTRIQADYLKQKGIIKF